MRKKYLTTIAAFCVCWATRQPPAPQPQVEAKTFFALPLSPGPCFLCFVVLFVDRPLTSHLTVLTDLQALALGKRQKTKGHGPREEGPRAPSPEPGAPGREGRRGGGAAFASPAAAAGLVAGLIGHSGTGTLEATSHWQPLAATGHWRPLIAYFGY
jgi:hypothetical protein